MRRVTLSPSQLGWLRADCERCLHREVAYGVRRLGGPPDIFNLADGAMKTHFEVGRGDVEHDLGVGPRFKVVSQGMHVQSRPLSFADLDVEVVVKGRLDALLRTADDEVIVCDYKTATREEISRATYEMQLHAYAHALENPTNANAGSTVDGLALLVLRPREFKWRPRRSGLYGDTEWLEVVRDDTSFLGLVRRIAELVAGTRLPDIKSPCEWCRYFGAIPSLAAIEAAS